MRVIGYKTEEYCWRPGGEDYCWRPGGRDTVLNRDPAHFESIFCPKNGCSFALFVNYSEISVRILQHSEYINGTFYKNKGDIHHSCG